MSLQASTPSLLMLSKRISAIPWCSHLSPRQLSRFPNLRLNSAVTESPVVHQ